MTSRKQPGLLGLSIQELTAAAEALGEPSYRGRQLFEALYRQRKTALQDVTNLPLALRNALAERYSSGVPEVEKQFQSVDGTIRYLIALEDAQTVETVWMPEGDGGDTDVDADPASNFDRATICVSSQVGCAVNCQFCMTALLGVKRNLTAGEIVGQIIAVLNERGVSPENERINLVFMGMGEPFLNYDNFMKAVRLLVEGVGIPERRMTVSTAGIVPRIYDFAKERIRPKLAVSLNASNDPEREQIMPINRKWDLADLVKAAREFPLRPRERLTFEYVLLDNVNDSLRNAREVVRLLNGIKAKVNLIALNPGPEIPFGTPSEDRVAAFQQVLIDAGIPAFVRRPRGRDIYAACGQLKRTTELVTIG
jgi:23S rRNA (adenine2503-C2)-methyltransferase